MPAPDIAVQRLFQQRISQPGFERPDQVVAWLGAVQAQDYYGALWAAGLRMRHATQAAVEAAIAEKTIVRTWLMRGTLHFVTAADLRWMLELTRPRQRQLSDNYIRLQRFELDGPTLAKCYGVLDKALAGGNQLTRLELSAALERAGVATGGMRLMFILQRAQAEGLICQAARRGKQFTFALLDEWLPPGRTLAYDEAMAEFTLRYFASHGPATLQDFAWWAGLSLADARAGLDLVKAQLDQETVGDQTCWLAQSVPEIPAGAPGACLLPGYDEFLVSYTDRHAALDAQHVKLWNRATVLLSPTIVIDGRVTGTWKRTLSKSGVTIFPALFSSLDPAANQAFISAARRYAGFLELPLIVG
jgi:hypothetical protein